MSPRTFQFSINLTAEQVLWYYQGHINAVVVQADTGERVQLELRHFTPFIQHHGVRARFELVISSQGKFIALKKIN